MTLIKSAARLLFFIVFTIALMIPPPTSAFDEYFKSETIPETVSVKTGNKPKFATRNHSSLLHKLIVFSRNLPILFVVLHTFLQCMPFPRLVFKPYIFIMLKRLFMAPVKFTSNFLVIKPSFAV
jgi:hypothetical protein